jgi:hypothetical protein
MIREHLFVNIIMLLQVGAVGNYLFTGKYACQYIGWRV